MQAKRRRISMANMSAQPRPEERSLGRRVSKGLPRACRGDAPRRRALLLPGLGAVAIAFAASLACANAQSLPGPSGAELAPMLSPEAPPNFGGHGEARPLLAVFAATRASRGWAPTWLAEPKFDLASSAVPRSLPPDNPPVVYDPTVGPSLSPTQSALQATLERLIARDDRRNPLGSGDWRAARGAIAAFYAGRF